MSPQSKKEYLKTVSLRYQKASSRAEKARILTELCVNCHFNRKYAIRRLSSFRIVRRTKFKNKPGPKPKYQQPELITALKHIWITANFPCSKRLKAIIPIWLPAYQLEFGFLPLEILKKFSKISPASIDRSLKPIRHLYRGKGRSATKPGLLLKSHIPIQTNQWDEKRPGFLETDTLMHCGSSLEGHYAVSTTAVDIATGWIEQRATYGKGQRDIAQKIKEIEATLPFAILGFDCDNGNEFLNQALMRYFLNRKVPVQFTRSRPYHSNDNAHVEGKNWTHVRQWLGYRRFENPKIVDLLNALYENEWRLFHNFFMPSVKLQSKQRIGSKIFKRHDSPKTPYQRLLNSKFINPQTKQFLTQLFKTLNPFKLRKTIDLKIAKIHSLARLP
jgi:hypothetical protein